jgi:hypothetical protein
LIAVGLIHAIDASNSKVAQNTEAQPKKSTFRDPIVWATVGIFAATAVSVGVGLAQWRALSNTDTATRDLAAAALKQAEAAERQVTAMQGPLSEMQRQSALTIAQLRPKLTLSFKGPNERMTFAGKDGWFVTPVWENRGGSEGLNFWGWDSSKLFVPDAKPEFDFVTPGGKVANPVKTTIGLTEPRLQISRFLPSDEVEQAAKEKGNIILWGSVEYQESLPGNQPHHIHWCYKVFPVDAGNTYIFSYSLYRPECNSSD